MHSNRCYSLLSLRIVMNTQYVFAYHFTSRQICCIIIYFCRWFVSLFRLLGIGVFTVYTIVVFVLHTFEYFYSILMPANTIA